MNKYVIRDAARSDEQTCYLKIYPLITGWTTLQRATVFDGEMVDGQLVLTPEIPKSDVQEMAIELLQVKLQILGVY